eukprot:740804_1
MLFVQASLSHTNDSFWICNVLNEYGCNSPTIPPVLQVFINDQTPDDYYLPSDRCDYDTINMTYIAQSVDLSLLSLVQSDDFAQLPCEILIQLPSDILQNKHVDYLIDFDYWFVNDTYLDCNHSLSIQCPDSTHNSTTNDTTSVAINECYLGEQCLYPFVPSAYLTDFPKIAGMCQCASDCRLRPSKIDLSVLDTSSLCLSICGFICLFIYCINVATQWNTTRKTIQKDRKTKNTEATSPLTNDIPPIIGCCLFLYLVFFSSPNNLDVVFSRTSWSCEGQNEWNKQKNIAAAAVVNHTMPQSNYLCYVSGLVIYCTVIMMMAYFGLLNFVIYRQLSCPLNPLWKIKKRYWHLLVLVYVSIFSVFMIQYGQIGADPTTGACGPAVNSVVSMSCVVLPSLVSILSFMITTPLNVYYIWKHVTYQTFGDHDAHLIHLYKRLIVYSICISISFTCFLYVWIITYAKWESTIKPTVSNYYLCLFTNFQLTLDGNEKAQIMQNGNLLQYLSEVCVLDPDNDFPALGALYFIVFIGVTLTAIASMIFSCSLAKYHQWKNTVLSIGTRFERCIQCKKYSDLNEEDTTVEMHKVITSSEKQTNIVGSDL